jgi:hypothetical protein
MEPMLFGKLTFQTVSQITMGEGPREEIVVRRRFRAQPKTVAVQRSLSIAPSHCMDAGFHPRW